VNRTIGAGSTGEFSSSNFNMSEMFAVISALKPKTPSEVISGISASVLDLSAFLAM
jgi:hypothetical protein